MSHLIAWELLHSLPLLQTGTRALVHAAGGVELVVAGEADVALTVSTVVHGALRDRVDHERLTIAEEEVAHIELHGETVAEERFRDGQNGAEGAFLQVIIIHATGRVRIH